MTPEYESMKDYLLIARKTIARFAPKFYPALAQEMLKNEDAISHVATAIMEADWKWNPEYRSKTGTVRTKRAYRNQRAIWAIQGWMALKKRQHQTISLSYESENGENSISISGIIEDKKAYNPSRIVADKDDLVHTKKLINDLLTSGAISDKQREYITAYFLEGKTLQEVGKQFGVTREAVRQCISCGIKSLTELI